MAKYRKEPALYMEHRRHSTHWSVLIAYSVTVKVLSGHTDQICLVKQSYTSVWGVDQTNLPQKSGMG
jgi:hypothetical protein